jgi:CubicO group peptidase (beta-lactamase class C family)
LPAPDPLARDLGLLLRRAQSEERLPAVSAAVVRGAEVAWAETLGLADVESGREATTDTQFRIGSITKTFTAASIMQLRDEGKLALDDPLSRHVPGVAHGALTIRGLLTHLSGLQREPPGEIWETMEDPTREELLASLVQAEQVLEPGQHWHYSNLAYALLGEIVVRLSGRPWLDHVRERLFEPAGLERTTFGPEQPAASGYFVEPYSDAVQREHHVELAGSAPIGQLWSTAADLCRWAAFLADPDPGVLAPGTAEEMRAFQGLVDTERWTMGYGLGLMLMRHGDRVFFGHDGGMPGFLARMAYSAKDRAGAVVLVNSSSGAVFERLSLDLAVKTIEAAPGEPDPWRPGEPPPAELAGALGRWWTEGVEFVFAWRGGRLEARGALAPPTAPPAVFERREPDSYRTVSGRERGEALRLVRDEAGDVVKMYWATYPLTRTPDLFWPTHPSK